MRRRVRSRSPARWRFSRARWRSCAVASRTGCSSRATGLCSCSGTPVDRSATLPLFDMGMDDTAYPFLLFLSQAETEQVLVEHLAERGVAVRWNTRLTGHSADPDGVVRCDLVDVNGRRQQVGARYLVGCDGAHSTVREGAAIPFTGGRYPETFLLADAEADGLDPGAAHVWFGSAGPLFFFPLVRPAAWRLLTSRGSDPAVTGEDHPDGSPVEDRSSGARRAAEGRRPRDRWDGASRDSGVVDRVPDPSSSGRDVPRRVGVPRRGRRTHPQPRRCAGHEHRHPGRRQPRLEARPRLPWCRHRTSPGHLRPRTTAGRRVRPPVHRPGLHRRHLDRTSRPVRPDPSRATWARARSPAAARSRGRVSHRLPARRPLPRHPRRSEPRTRWSGPAPSVDGPGAASATR